MRFDWKILVPTVFVGVILLHILYAMLAMIGIVLPTVVSFIVGLVVFWFLQVFFNRYRWWFAMVWFMISQWWKKLVG